MMIFVPKIPRYFGFGKISPSKPINCLKKNNFGLKIYLYISNIQEMFVLLKNPFKMFNSEQNKPFPIENTHSLSFKNKPKSKLGRKMAQILGFKCLTKSKS